MQNVGDVHFSNTQLSIWSVQLYRNSVKELLTPFHWPKVDVEMGVVKGQQSVLHVHTPFKIVELVPQIRQFDRFVTAQFWQISWVQFGQKLGTDHAANTGNGHVAGV